MSHGVTDGHPSTGGQQADPKTFARAMADGLTIEESRPELRTGPRPWDNEYRDDDIVIWNADLMVHEFVKDRAATFCVNYNEGVRGTGVAIVPSDTPFNRDYEDAEA